MKRKSPVQSWAGAEHQRAGMGRLEEGQVTKSLPGLGEGAALPCFWERVQREIGMIHSAFSFP